MFLRRLFLPLGVMGLLGCAETGTVTSAYNPGLIVYNPAARVIAACGDLSIGLDSRWEFEEEFEPEGRNNTPRQEYTSRFSGEVSGRLNPSPLAKVTFKPSATIWLYCETQSSPPNEAARVADLFYQRSLENSSRSEVKRSGLNSESGVWEVVTYKRTNDDGDVSLRQRLYQQRGGRLVTLSLHSTEFNKTEVGGFVGSQQVYTLDGRDGEQVQGRLVRGTIVAPSGMLVGTRRRSVSEDFFEDVRGTLKNAGAAG